MDCGCVEHTRDLTVPFRPLPFLLYQATQYKICHIERNETAYFVLCVLMKGMEGRVRDGVNSSHSAQHIANTLATCVSFPFMPKY